MQQQLRTLTFREKEEAATQMPPAQRKSQPELSLVLGHLLNLDK